MTTAADSWDTKQLPIKTLSMWDENSRIPDYLLDSEEHALIQILLKKYDLQALAEEIVKDFDLPQLEKFVVWKDGKKLVVLEGNRRLAVYRCLIDPSIVEDNQLREFFEELGRRISISGNFKLEAVVTQDKAQGMRFIERKHYFGNNEKRWEQYERDHYIKRTRNEPREAITKKERDSIFRANVADKVKLVSLPDSIKQTVLGRGYATTFFRVVNGAEGRKKLKYERSDYTLLIEDEEEFLKLLKVIIYNIVNKKTLDGAKKLNSRTLNQDKQIRAYLDTIKSSDADEVDNQVNAAKEQSKARQKKGRKKGTKKPKRSQGAESTALIEPDLQLPKNAAKKISAVFTELQRINVTLCPTASSILVRILIEITIDEFLRRKRDTSVANAQLVKKINHVKDRYIIDPDLKKTVDIMNNDLLTKKLNQVAHNTIFLATGTTIKDLWKNLYSFFEFMVPGIKRV